MKLVPESLNESVNFERGADPKSNLGIGKVAEAKKMLEDEFGTGINSEYYTFKIHSLDNIEITYSEDFQRKFKDEAVKTIWKIRYVEKDQFVTRYHQTQEWGMSNTWVIDKQWIYWRNLNDIKIKTENYLSVHTGKPDVDIIAKALNDHYGPIKGFELIERISNES